MMATITGTAVSFSCEAASVAAETAVGSAAPKSMFTPPPNRQDRRSGRRATRNRPKAVPKAGPTTAAAISVCTTSTSAARAFALAVAPEHPEHPRQQEPDAAAREHRRPVGRHRAHPPTTLTPRWKPTSTISTARPSTISDETSSSFATTSGDEPTGAVVGVAVVGGAVLAVVVVPGATVVAGG